MVRVSYSDLTSIVRRSPSFDHEKTRIDTLMHTYSILRKPDVDSSWPWPWLTHRDRDRDWLIVTVTVTDSSWPWPWLPHRDRDRDCLIVTVTVTASSWPWLTHRERDRDCHCRQLPLLACWPFDHFMFWDYMVTECRRFSHESFDHFMFWLYSNGVPKIQSWAIWPFYVLII